MELSVEVESKSSVLRQLTVKVPAQVVKKHIDRGLAAVQKTANLKGFRSGHAPISIIERYYGKDVRHRVLHSLIDESFEKAIRDQNLKTVGSPTIDTPQHQTGDGVHDHTLREDQDLTYIATVEVIPEIRVKDYLGVSVSQEKVEVTDEQVSQVVERLYQAEAQLVPALGGMVLPDGTESSRPVQMHDFVDIQFSGGVVLDNGVHAREDMKGQQLLELGSNSFIPGFEDHLIGLRRGETKTFRVTFPEGYPQKELSGKEAEFTVTIHEIKEKQLPALDDEFAKQAGYEGLDDLRLKARDYLHREQTENADQKVKSELLGKIIEKNPFDIPGALIEGQTRSLAQDWAQELKKQGFDEKMIQDAILAEHENLRKRAEGQVRASLILDSIAQEEEISVSSEEVSAELDRLAGNLKVERSKLQDYYAKNPGRKRELEFRLRQDRSLKFLLDKAKVKLVSGKDK